MQIVIFVLFVVMVIVGLIFANQQQKKRYAALQELCNRMGLTFIEDGIPLPNSMGLGGLFGLSTPPPQMGIQAGFATFFPLFGHGSARRIEPALVGQDRDGNYWFLFDYRYTVSSGKSSTTYHFSVVVAQVPLMLPTMSLAPENVGYSIGKFLGMREMQVESEEFNKRYFIKTTDEKMTLDLLNPIAIETLLRQPPYEWQMAGPYVMLHLSGQIQPELYEGLTVCIREFLAQVPAFYKQDHGAFGAPN
ncbi:MAG: hypothetical protein JST12_05785 [Armatimonadetes bacterium]|nr:hypothetical protein [Armatimonadota bacterium]